MRCRLLLVLLAALAVVLLSAFPAYAADGRVLLWQPTTISQPGYYLLTRDLPALASGFTIAASDVTLDLGGHRLDFASAVYAIWVNAGATRITIRNGTIAGASYGVYSHSPISRTRIALEDLTVIDATSCGLYVYGAEHADVSGCIVGSVNFDAIYLHGASGPFDGRIVANTVYRAGASGIYTGGARGMEIARNTVHDVGQVSCCYKGIELTSDASWDAGGNIVSRNTLRFGRGNDSQGITTYPGSNRNQILENVIEGNSGDGIWLLSSGNRVANNVISKNAKNGVRVEGTRNLVEGNLVEGNAQYGVAFMNANGHAYRNNMLRGNTLGPNTGAAPDADQGGNIR